MTSRTQSVEFINQNGDVLSAKIEFPPDRKPYAYAVFAHCFTCNKSLTSVRRISRALAGKGIAVLRFDFTGLGDSKGKFEDTSFTTNITDILAAASFLKENYEEPSLLIGHSLGGTACIFASLSLEHVKGVVTIGSPADPAHVKHLIKDCIAEIKTKGSAEVNIAGRVFTIGKQFLEDLMHRDVAEILSDLKKALLIMHAPFDKTVGIENAKWLYSHAFHPKSFISLDGADHILSNKEDSTYVGEVIGAWAGRYLPRKVEKNLESNMQVVVSLEAEDDFTTIIKAGDHYITADEPPSVGGDDFGPAPYELLAASLGACTAMTLQLYANRKKWDIGEVQVHLQHNKVYADDQQDSLEGGKRSDKIDLVERQISFSAPLSDDQKTRLIEIADRCPVHRTLESKVIIKTELRD